jgi:hypothetical protein
MSIEKLNPGNPVIAQPALEQFLNGYDARLLELNRLYPIGHPRRNNTMLEYRNNQVTNTASRSNHYEHLEHPI